MRRISRLWSVIILAILISFGCLNSMNMTAMAAENVFSLPMKNCTLTSGFQPNRWGNVHLAVDYVDSTGDWTIYPIYDGTVYRVDNVGSSDAGKYVSIKHQVNGTIFYSLYQHLNEVSVSVGTSVVGGATKLGIGGTTGYVTGRHLHMIVFSGTYAPWITSAAADTWANCPSDGTIWAGPVVYGDTTYYNAEELFSGAQSLAGITGSVSPDSPASILQFTDVTYPKTFKINTTNGWSLGSGTLASNYKLSTICSQIVNRDTAVTVSDSGIIDISSYGYSYAVVNLDNGYNNTADNGVRFSWITTEGNYKWMLTATDASGRELTLTMLFTVVSSESTSPSTASLSYIPVTGVTLSSTSIVRYPGQTATLAATVSPSNANNKAVSWSSSDTSVATVSENGMVTAVANGTATITCKTVDGGFTASCTITVRTPVTGVELDTSTATLYKGDTIQLMATILPSTADRRTVSWTSSDASVATVSENGMVTAVGWGEAVISCTTYDGGYTATCDISVDPMLTRVSLDYTVASLEIAWGIVNQCEFKANVYPSDEHVTALNWKSSAPSVASVDANGKVTALAQGQAKISCTVHASDGSQVSNYVVVTVSDDVLILPDDVMIVEKQSFSGNSAISLVEFPNAKVTIETEAFMGCTNLQYVYFPHMDAQIDDSAFSGCEEVTFICQPESDAEAYAEAKGFNVMLI